MRPANSTALRKAKETGNSVNGIRRNGAVRVGEGTPHTRSTEERNRLILDHAPLVRYIAGRLALRIPAHVDRADIESAGIVGLIDAADKFDESRGVRFRAYAEIRIRGAILDELRARDWLPRSVREKGSRLQEAYADVERRLGRSATDEEVAEAMGVDMEEFHTIVNDVNGGAVWRLADLGIGDDEKGNMAHNLMVDDTAEDLPSILSGKERRKRLAEAIDSLPEKERLVVTLYYHEELTLKEIGEIFGVSESRVCQIHTKAVCRLKGRLREMLS